MGVSEEGVPEVKGYVVAVYTAPKQKDALIPPHTQGF